MALEKFHFTTSDGDKIAVPYMKDAIRRKQMRDINKKFKTTQDGDALEEAMFDAAGFDKKTMDIIENMTIGDYEKFVTAWTGQEDATLGGIAALADALDSEPDFCRAVEYDLIALGLRLRWLCDGSDRLNWRDLLVIVHEAGRDSALVRHELGEVSQWTVNSHLLAGIFDVLQGANWQRSGGKGEKPKPLERPKPKSTPQPVSTKPVTNKDTGEQSGFYARFGDDFEPDSLTPAEMDAWLGLTPKQPALSPREQAVIEYNAGGVTQKTLAAKYGVSPSTISRWVKLTNLVDTFPQ